MSRFPTRAIDPTAEFLIREFESEKKYGSIELKYEAGRMVLAKKLETIKPIDQSTWDGDGNDE